MPDDLRKIAHQQNERDGLGPTTDPGVLRMVACLIVEWRERQEAEDREADR
jgi:hypothetical protein